MQNFLNFFKPNLRGEIFPIPPSGYTPEKVFIFESRNVPNSTRLTFSQKCDCINLGLFNHGEYLIAQQKKGTA